MERRKFLGKAALAGIPVVLASNASAQSFGIPASLNAGTLPLPKDGKLTIPMDDSFIPLALRDVNRSVMSLFNNAVSNPELARDLSKNPAAVLQQYGLSNYIEPNDPLLEGVRLAADVDMASFMKTADYPAFMTELKSKGYLVPLSKTKLRAHYHTILSNDHEGFVKYLKTILDKNPTSIPAAQARTERINRIVDLLEDGNGNRPLAAMINADVDPGEDSPMVVAAAVAVAYIAVVAVTYVVAASQLGVVLNVGAVATVYSQIAVWGGGGSEFPVPVDPGTLPGTQIAGPQDAVAENVRNMQRSAFAASFFGRKDLAVEAVKTVIDKELTAMLEAAEQLELVKFPVGNRKRVVSELKKLCYDAVGLGA